MRGRNSLLHVIREGGLSLFGSHGKGSGPRVSHCDARVQVEVKNFLSFFPSFRFSWISGQFFGTVYWGRTSVGQDVMGQKVVGQEVSGAGRCGAELRGAGRHWGRTSLGQDVTGAISLGQDVVGQNFEFVGQDVTGAISLGQKVVGQEVSGAELRGAGRRWGNIPGAGCQWGRRFWGRK